MNADGSHKGSSESLKIVIVGHVDHGKSTLVGRLLHDTGSLPSGKIDAMREMCARRGVDFKWSFLMDALQIERNQGVTVDTAQIRFRTPKRGYVIIDAPGHREFLKNMITGASNSDAALLLIDAEEGIREQSRRHGYLLHLLGIRQVVVAVNKMDLVGYDRARFEEIADAYTDYLGEIGVTPRIVLPIAAREGDNIAARSPRLDWYDGPTVADALDELDVSPPPTDLPLRLPVQDVYNFDKRRIIVGRVESGQVSPGDRLTFLPSKHVAQVANIENWRPRGGGGLAAVAGQSIGLTLDDQIVVQRGEIASHLETTPKFSRTLRARIFWLGEAPLEVGRQYQLRLNTARHRVTVQSIENVVDVDTLSVSQSERIGTNDVAEITLHADAPLALDTFAASPRTGRFVLMEGFEIVGGGVITGGNDLDARDGEGAAGTITTGTPGLILWLTGLSGAGKSTLAAALKERLEAAGRQVCVLDGDALRTGINADLGFSPEDRAENVRRTGEIAALFADAGFVVIAALISPYEEDRARVRAIRPAIFHEIYVSAGLDICEARDPKGLYREARAGKIDEFSGVSAPYEAPSTPELTVDTSAEPVSASADRLMTYIDQFDAL